MLAYGVVFVLLLGEIDLSISYVAGIGALVAGEFVLPASGHEIPGEGSLRSPPRSPSAL